ncbi:Putative aliphatic sulfonates transport permease protein ssuC [Providencia rettgeri]|uniref:Aliphatic sulfonates transport permease protein ssuC n=1 Tax=Providencia rettgeri TaxID=587 RepID=A0A9N8H1J4_PRORE|nr:MULTISPECIES: ABC transporter permease [Providencia]CAB5671992.1 Putative aliphatic sulfonates transport permease protein ssuC [Providencia rettgeri]CAB5718313.1 Putative aliphatic sulfonates transport permease protein ssuC [Providencia rettgeri]CAC9198476.1 Putative aliphatic sulfonates transport permease protein ssuC [Providencia rettgeri]CAC9215570.1 Putative aliphatic sulfonates transport permease protein ssuC [Providencia rettgeri]
MNFQLYSGQLWQDISISLSRVLIAFAIAAIFAFFLGIIMALSLRTNQIFNLTLNAIRQIPPLAWIPLLILWFGIGEVTKIILIIKSAFFPILLSTINGIQTTPMTYIELGNLYQFNIWQKLRKIYIPSLLPNLFTGLRLAMGLSWATVVAAEMIAANSGIGYRINDARIMLDSPVVIVGILVIGIVGLLLDKILLIISYYLLPWLRTERK